MNKNFLYLVSILITFPYFNFANNKKNIKHTNIDVISSPTKIQPTLPDTSSIHINYLIGNFDPSKDSLFVKVSLKYAKRDDLYVRKEAYDAFINMYNAALKDSIHLIIVSATRNFDYQKDIWEKKWTGQIRVDGKNLNTSIPVPVERAKIILKYTSMPGTSRHHWGTDIDLNSVKDNYFETEEGEKIYTWLQSNAPLYGFCQPYISDTLQTGYEEEKWHWSYIPLAKEFLIQYKNQVTYEHLTGFKGSESAKEINVIDNYVSKINNNCY